jgi:aminopeptidase YwaD
MNTIWTHLEQILRHGARPIGSPANQAAADAIRNAFAALGLDVEEQPYACTAWDHGATLLEQDGKTLDATANAFSLPCDVTAPVLPVASLPELETAPAKGKMLLLYGDLARAPLSPKSWFLKDERDDRIITLLENLEPAAILSPPTDTDYCGQLTEDWELDLSAATISIETALKILREPGKPVHLRIQAQRQPATARNLVARTRGQQGKRLVLCAHFDTKINTPGASDNGGGVAALLALAGCLKGRSLPFGLEFIAFGSEEYLPIGDEEYLRRAEGYWSEILACINFDGIGPALGTTSLTCMGGPDSLADDLRALAKNHPGVVWVEPWPESNHSTFAMRGVQAVAFGAVGMRGLAHSPADCLEIMSVAKLEEAVGLAERIVQWFACAGSESTQNGY